MTPLEMFSTGLVVISAVALGLSLILTAARGATLGRRRRALHQLVQARNDEIEAVVKRAETADELIRKREALCGELETRRVRLDAATKAAAEDKVELVHELGTPQADHTLFRCELRTVADFSRIDTRRVVFARPIWERRNVALVWASTAEAAMTAVRRAFPEHCGVLPGRLHRDSESAGAPAAGPVLPFPGGGGRPSSLSTPPGAP